MVTIFIEMIDKMMDGRSRLGLSGRAGLRGAVRGSDAGLVALGVVRGRAATAGTSAQLRLPIAVQIFRENGTDAYEHARRHRKGDEATHDGPLQLPVRETPHDAHLEYGVWIRVGSWEVRVARMA